MRPDALKIDRDTLYPQETLLAMFSIAKATLGRWHKMGLKRLRPGTDRVYYLGADILDFWANLPGVTD